MITFLDGKLVAALPTQAAVPVNPDLTESDRAWDIYAAARLAALETEPRIKAAYWSIDDPIRRFGLPTGLLTEAANGSSVGLKMAYASFQIARRDTPFAKAGDLTVSNHGDLILDAEPFSRRVFEPEPLFPDQQIAMVIPAA